MQGVSRGTRLTVPPRTASIKETSNYPLFKRDPPLFCPSTQDRIGNKGTGGNRSEGQGILR